MRPCSPMRPWRPIRSWNCILVNKMVCVAVFLLVTMNCAGCSGSRSSEVKTDAYDHVIGVSMINMVEPWLYNLAQVMTDMADHDANVNLILLDAANNSQKQAEDISSLMNNGIDLLIMASDGSDTVDAIQHEVYEKIPVIAVGIQPHSEEYTTLIQADHLKIGQIAGEYILEHFYHPGDKVVVMQGVQNSPISLKRLEGFKSCASEKIPEKDISYYEGEWMKDRAELRLKDYLVSKGKPDIIFAFNDDMAFGCYTACRQLRVSQIPQIIGVDGFEGGGETAGRQLLDKGILQATIKSPDFGALAYDTALKILDGQETDRQMSVVPQLIDQVQADQD